MNCNKIFPDLLQYVAVILFIVLPSFAIAAVPTADFTAAPTSGCNYMTTQFTDASTGGDGPLTYQWEFFSNYNIYSISPVSSTEQNPTVSFGHYDGTDNNGYADVRLTVTDADGDTDVILKENYISVRGSNPHDHNPCTAVSAGFAASQTSGEAPLTVGFTNTSSGYAPPLTYEWDFDNDGTVDSTDENPSYTYSTVGTYTVKLTATDQYGRADTIVKSDYILVKIGSVPEADFTGTPTSGTNPVTVNFTNATTDGEAPLAYEWDFDNDGTVDSTDENPSHTYTSSGSFTVSLKVTDVHGDTDSVIKEDYVFVTTNSSVPTADFTAAPTSGCNYMTTQFTDASTGGDGPLTYQWEFFSNYNIYSISPVSSTEQNPTVSFGHYDGTDNNGYADVRLTVTDADGDTDVILKENYISVRGSNPHDHNPCTAVSAGFAASQTSGEAPLTVGFTNTSSGYAPLLTYEWDFDNDGTVDSTDENPSYTYSTVGTYTVKLTATDQYGRADTIVKSDYILVKIGSVPEADFTGTPTSGTNPVTVNFTNATTDGEAPLAYEWDFDNDGTVDSTDENPSHTYTSSGSFTVSLKVTDVHGDTDSVIKEDYVFVTTNSSVPTADFTAAPTSGCNYMTTQFTDASTGGDGPLTYQWEFFSNYNIYSISPVSSTEQNPTVSFGHYDGTDNNGYADVRLTVTDADGDTDVILKENYISVRGSNPHDHNPCTAVSAGFAASQTSGEAPLTVGFTNTSSGYAPLLTYEWDFDNDGTVDSTDENPSYTYNALGLYTVTLKATDLYGRFKTETKTDYITVETFTGDISAGHEHTLLIKPDGSLWAWGRNNEGQLGDGTKIDRMTPVQIGSDTDWRAVSAGWGHSIALKGSGTLWAWGDNNYRQVGDGTAIDRLAPVQIGSNTDWIAIDAGGAHNLAVKSDRTLWAWGLNSVGQLGDGTTTIRLAPVQIGNDSDWSIISAGWEHSAAIKSDKSLYTWGWNDQGQLGDGSTTDRHSPTIIGFSEWIDVSSGWKHTVAHKDNDTLWAWGDNDYGQLGDGTTTDRLSPVPVGGGISNSWIIESGGAHTMVRTLSGELWAWGLNSVGQLGDGTTTKRLTPVLIGTTNDWDIISAGWEHTTAMKEDGSFWIWGWNAYGQLGDGTTTDSHSPIPVSVDSIPVADFTGSPTYGCALHFFTVGFTNYSTGGDPPLSYYWDFGDGAISTEVHPSHDYGDVEGTSPVNYSVELTVADADGDTDTMTLTDYITADPRPMCNDDRARIKDTSLHYYRIQDAYDAAIGGDTILSRDIHFTEDLIIDHDISVSLEGGFDSGFSTITGNTVIEGNMIISNGAVTIQGGILEIIP